MKRLILLLLVMLPASLLAQVKLARIFSDHVVLQRQKSIPIWGWAKPGEKVTVLLGTQKLAAKADGQGKWLVKFNPMEAGGPYTISVTAKSGNVSVQDVLIGEVWLCSGQSNMEWPVSASRDFEKEKKNANYPQIRQFKVAHEVSLTPEADLKSGDWKLASSETVGDFTAVGFFFAREIYEKINVPIGLVNSSWGGSQIEGWISKEGMQNSEVLKYYADTFPQSWEEVDKRLDAKLKKQFLKNSPEASPQTEEAYTKGNFQFSNWPTIDPIGQWDWKGLLGFRGQGFMAKLVDMPADMVAGTTTLSLPENDSQNDIYINGKLVKSITQEGTKLIEIPANTWKSGENQLVIKLGNMKKLAWFGPGFAGKSSDLYIKNDKRNLSIGTEWKVMPSFASPHEYAHLMNNAGAIMYNSMIAPITSFGIRGVLWYQGETNAGRAYQYRESFPLMINDWRRLWNDQLSFYFVQLSSFGRELNSNQGSSWAELREAQTMTLSLPKTGMAVTTDIGNPKDIHPTNKQDVGHRLAIHALKQDYGQNLLENSPFYQKMKIEGNKIIVSLNNVENGITIKNKYGYVQGFEIAGEDKVFRYAQATIVNKEIVVTGFGIDKPIAVRYNWSDATEEGQLFNADGYPLAPFRTDNWPGITVNNKFE